MVRERRKRRKKFMYLWLLFSALAFLFLFFAQTVWVHREESFTPKYKKILLTETTDSATIFHQTGLGEHTVERILREKDFKKILEVQDAFFSKDEVWCKPIFGWVTRSDRVEKSETAPLVDLQSGDIIVSLSTHSLGWRHGHVGLVLDKNSVLECTTLGKESSIVHPKHWRKYSNYVVLRVKGVTCEMQQNVVEYAREVLCGVPYRLTSGFGLKKAPSTETEYFGLQCAYLAWYAWQKFGYDVDSDGGRLVTANDILHADCLEVVQVYGMNPMEMD